MKDGGRISLRTKFMSKSDLSDTRWMGKQWDFEKSHINME